MKENIRQKIFDFIGISLGTLLTALALNLFLQPNQIAPGGVSGLAIEINYLTGLPTGTLTIIINVPLFLIAIKVLGARFGVKTFYATILLGVLIDLTSGIRPLTNDSILAAVYGGLIMGLGLGLVIKYHATTGGTDLAAMVLHKYIKTLTVGRLLLIIDFVIIAIAGIIFNPEKAMYALAAEFLAIKLIDIIQEGITTNRVALIISKRHKEIISKIMKELDRGATLLEGTGAFSGHHRDVVMCVVDKSQVAKLRDIVRELDDRAFVVILDAYDVIGEGFNKI
ncbi:YitT family protein [Caldanaerobius polysaccharolyticus]|uniref:YitT family protein n=1 Tax=Caldanaerobius polysaccharolyticus TaxID=44256 RepID=UPI00047A8117|nr:YitT family protein [Caldanaerobius polysaccharolyticus]